MEPTSAQLADFTEKFKSWSASDSRLARRSQKGERYARLVEEVQLMSEAPEGSADGRQWKRWSEQLGAKLRSEPSQVHVATVLTNLSVQYADPEFIAEQLMPVINTRGKLSSTFFRYPKRERRAAPDDNVGIRQTPNEITSSRTLDTVSLTPRALREFVSDTTLANQDAPLNEMFDATIAVNNAMGLKQESRVAAIVTDPANYDGNTVALGAANRWDDTGIDPSIDILAARREMWDGNGAASLIGVAPIEVWDVLKLNADIKELYKFIGPTGFIDRATFAAWYGLNDIIVASTREDTANEGQTEVYSRIWGDDFFAILRVARTPTIRNASFGYIFKDRAGLMSDVHRNIEVGMDGGSIVRSKQATAEKVIAGDTSFLIQTVRG